MTAWLAVAYTAFGAIAILVCWAMYVVAYNNGYNAGRKYQSSLQDCYMRGAEDYKKNIVQFPSVAIGERATMQEDWEE